MRLGRSGTAGLGPLGTRDSDFRERPRAASPCESRLNPRPSNGANRFESFGFLLTARAAVDSPPAFRAHPSISNAGAPVAELGAVTGAGRRPVRPSPAGHPASLQFFINSKAL